MQRIFSTYPTPDHSVSSFVIGLLSSSCYHIKEGANLEMDTPLEQLRSLDVEQEQHIDLSLAKTEDS